VRDNSRVRWHYRDPALLWLLPLAYALHILEEWFAGFPEWVALVVGSPLPRTVFVIINAIAMTAMIAAIRAATAREDYGWMGIAAASILFVNAFAHVLGSVATKSYSPGLISGVVLYLPVAGLVLLRAWSQAQRGAFARGIAVGVAVHAAVFVVAYRLTG
jgi:hypothetical protein